MVKNNVNNTVNNTVTSFVNRLITTRQIRLYQAKQATRTDHERTFGIPLRTSCNIEVRELLHAMMLREANSLANSSDWTKCHQPPPTIVSSHDMRQSKEDVSINLRRQSGLEEEHVVPDCSWKRKRLDPFDKARIT